MPTLQRPDGPVAIGDTLPLLPLRDIVLFPHMIAPLLVGRPGSVSALEDAMAADRLLFVATQRSPDTVEPRLEDVHRMGTIGRVLQMLRLQDGTFKVLLEGLARARMARVARGEGTTRVKFQTLEDVQAASAETEALRRNVAAQFSEYVRLHKRIPDEVLLSIVGIEDPAMLADVLAAHLITKVAVKQRLLESVDLATRFRVLGQVLNEELEILQIERRIEGEVKNSVKKNQKEFYLNEQLKAIRKELGQGEPGSSDAESLHAAVDDAKMSQEARMLATQEIERLSRMPALSPEAAVVRTYVETLCALPWRRRTRDRLDLAAVRQKLDADHYGLEKLKERILEFLAVTKLTRALHGPILCFVGPPGVGKTSLGRSIAEAMGRKFVRVSLGGVHDEAEIRGHRRTYIGAMPGRIVQSLRKCGSANPVFLLDEIDKLGSDFRGDPSAALLEALDPEQNFAFSDHYLEVGFDLSKVLFITTANVLHTIPPALLDRMEVLQLPGYLDHEKLAIARQFLLPKQLAEHGLGAADLEIEESALERIVHEYTREAGVRGLEREIGRVCRKVARQVAETRVRGVRRRESKRVDGDVLQEYLGVAPYRDRSLPSQPEVGVATGLAWTPSGGEVLSIEVMRIPGRGDLILTGQLGDVMRESARAAFSCVRSILGDLGVRRDAFEQHDVHVHVPEGAIPKDGPSAGLAIAVALASLASGRAVDRRLAMTGEITLLGRILPVGGLNEKTVAAVRAAITTVFVPEANAKDLSELPAHVREKLEIVEVNHVGQVLDVVLGNRRRRRPRHASTASSRAPVGIAH